MADDKEPTQAAKPTPKMVPESTLIMKVKEAKEKERALKDEMATLKQQNADLKSELEVSHTDAEDSEEVAKVKAYLLGREKELNEKAAKVEKDLASLSEREKEAKVQSLAFKYQLEIDDIKDAEDPEKEALRMVNERFAREKEESKEKEAPPESVMETGSPALKKVSPKDLPLVDFEKAWEQKKREATLSR